MKSLKQSALVLAIAGLPLSGYAELKPLHDADMGQITGQAGVTIELETQVTMDEFTYTDEGTLASATSSLAVRIASICSRNSPPGAMPFSAPAVRI